jgi:cysteinyl-tRNA synthetase
MSLRLYNTRTRSIEPFVPLRDRHVRIYVCGLTPSAEAHLGHARSFLFFDVLRRYLEYSSYAVTFVRNVTDIDDRSIATARETGESWSAVIGRHFDSFSASMQRLDVRPPDSEPRATAYIGPIVEMIGELVQTGHAYTTEDGVYFAVKTFPRYGALSHRNVDELLAGARIAIDEHKHDALDFALWKFAKPGEPAWESPWGAGLAKPGRPGWHIECSAMARVLLGEPFDIHGGGFDLVFPHHENEIAQSESLMPQPPLANVWMHGGLLMFDGKKMSKSLGNFEPLHALLDRHDPQAIRLLFLGTGYRKPMNFTEDAISGATAALDRLRKAYAKLSLGSGDHEVLAGFERRFFAAFDDDMNTAGALGVLFEAAADPRVRGPEAIAFFDTAQRLFGISGALDVRPAESIAVFDDSFVARLAAALGDAVHLNGHAPEAAIATVLEARNAARAGRDFALADRLRKALAAQRIIITDNKDGTTTWSFEH